SLNCPTDNCSFKMAQYRSRSLPFWPIFFTALAVLFISSIYMVGQDGSSINQIFPVAHLTKEIREKKLAEGVIKKYGMTRELEKSICLESENVCVSVQDVIWKEENRYKFIRAVVYKDTQFTTMNLKLPEKYDKEHLDTTKWELDKTSLNSYCYTPVMIEEMFTSGAVRMNRQAEANVLVVGLGAGYLNSHLHATFPKMNLTGVEIEPKMVRIARKWFGLVLDSRQRVYTMDGAKFMNMAVREGRKYDAILVDVCSVDKDVELTCPSSAFVQTENVKDFANAITERGVVLLNVLSLKISASKAVEKVKSVYDKMFRNCIVVPAEDSPPNVVLSCTQHVRPKSLKDRYDGFLKSLERVVLLNVLSLKISASKAVEKVKSVYDKVFRNCIVIPVEDSPPNVVLSCTQHIRPKGLKDRYEGFLKSLKSDG
ncbi:hypothetical protein V3C99_000620, partial [Haemonchus contortus]